MIKKIVYLMVTAVLLFPLFSPQARAAFNTVTASDSTVSIVIPGNGFSYTVGTSLSVESFVVNNSSVVFTMPAGSEFSMSSTNNSQMSVDGANSCTVTTVCTATQPSSVTVSCPTGATKTVTVAIEAGTCPVGTSSGGGGGGGGGGGSPAPTPVVITPPVVTPVVPVLPVVTPSVSTPVANEQAIEVANPNSAVAIKNLPASSVQTDEILKFNYQFTNTSGKIARYNLLRQMINSKGKVVKRAVGFRSLKPNATLVVLVSEPVNLPAGEYTEKVKISDSNNKLVAENSFVVQVTPVKKKVLNVSGVEKSEASIAFDAAKIAQIKSGSGLPAKLSIKYSYTNTTNAPQIIRMVRELVDASGKSVAPQKTGTWTMKPGEKSDLTVSQMVDKSLKAGDYAVRVRAYDKGTGVLLSENSVGFSVGLK